LFETLYQQTCLRNPVSVIWHTPIPHQFKA